MAGAPVDGAWRIVSDGELREIVAAGTGLVIGPGNRWWHTAACPHIAAMTAGQPKWYARTPAAREAFLELRVARYATAQPVRPCPSCGKGVAVPYGSAVPVSWPARGAAAGR